jgi:hypothetical protein
MVKKLTVIFAVCLFALFIFAGGASAAVDKKKAEGTSLRLPLVIESESHIATPRAPLKYPTWGGKVVTCDDINPAVGTIIQHDQIGVTGFDYQANGTLGRLICVTNDGYRHLVFDYDIIEADPSDEETWVACKDPTGSWEVGVAVGPAENRNRYPRASCLNDGRVVVVSTYYAGTPTWHTALTVDDQLCGGFFNRKWDIPDRPCGGIEGGWPEMVVKYDVEDERDYIHIMTTERADELMRLGYIRCYFDDHPDSLICETFHGGETQEYRICKDEYVSDTYHPICAMDTSCFITGTLEASPVSKKVVLVYMRPQYCEGSAPCEWNHEVAYIESQDNGDDWVAGNNLTIHQVTDYGCGQECGAFEVSACYDYNDDLHIVWITNYFEDPPGGGSYTPGWSKLYHWSKATGIITNIASGIYAGATPPQNRSNIHTPTISAKDPIYHPGGPPDSVYLFVVWSQTDTLDLGADDAFSNCDLWGVGSFDGGAGWARPFNLTRTNTDSCAPGECVSEDYPNLAVNMHNGDLHIQYICDLDPGAQWNGQGTWQESPVYYYHLTEWDLEAECRTDHNIEPSSWHQPFLKVPPGGNRSLTLTITNIGNASCDYTVTSDDPCIDVEASGAIDPGQQASVSIAVKGTGDCDSSFIDGNVILWTSEEEKKTQYLPVQAVVAEDYYECPKDPETVDTLENDYMKFYTNANCQEWMFDISTFLSATGEDTTIEVFFQGGTFVATHSEDYIDTVVGRYMGTNDQHAGAREKLYVEDRGDYWVLYTCNIFMHDLNPPSHDSTWYWFELIKEIVFFKPTATDARQHFVIKYVTVERHDPPAWWPTPPPPTRGYQDTYVGIAMDIDCPFDTAGVETGDENGVNRGRYDPVNHIAYQVGFGREHTAYSTYHAGIAMINGGGGDTTIEAYKTHCIKNNQYLYPQTPWGWKDGELYELASDISGGRHQVDFGFPAPDSIVDRTYVVTAQKIEAERDVCDAKASFTMVEVVAPEGELQMIAFVDSARQWVANNPLILCGDVNADGSVELGDIVYLINFVFRAGDPPVPPVNRGDVNSDCSIELGDIVYLINFVFRSGDPPNCPGVW